MILGIVVTTLIGLMYLVCAIEPLLRREEDNQ